jgi:hypothetical protein
VRQRNGKKTQDVDKAANATCFCKDEELDRLLRLRVERVAADWSAG